jgi:arylsulfatase
VYPDAGYTPFRGTERTDREGGTRVPSIALGPGIKPSGKNAEIVGGLDCTARLAALGRAAVAAERP